MKKTIKMIGLLIKIVNKEQPKKIQFDTETYVWDKKVKSYIRPRTDNNKFYKRIDEDYNLIGCLNDEIEVIEEMEELTVQKASENYCKFCEKLTKEVQGKSKVPNINLDNMKDIGTKVGKAYRELFEGLNEGWNTLLEKDKEIEKLNIKSDEATPNSYYILNEHGKKCYLTKHSKIIANKVNSLIEKVYNLEKKNKEK